MTKEEFFNKTDGEINRAIAGKLRYYYLISVVLPCSLSELKQHYSEHDIEFRKCHNCKPLKWDLIFTLIDKVK